MAIVKLNKFPKHLQSKLESAIKQLTNPNAMKKIGDDAAASILKRTKLGYGVESPLAAQSKLKPLSDNYIKQRKTMKLDPSASVKKSNLTQTGAMLNDMVVKSEEGKTTIEFATKKSSDKVKWNADMGRTFFNISKAQMAAIVSGLQKKLKELLNK